MRSFFLTFATACVLIAFSFGQQTAPPKPQNQKKPAAQASTTPAESTANKPDSSSEQRPPAPPAFSDKDRDKEEHFDMTEVAPVATHHQITVEERC